MGEPWCPGQLPKGSIVALTDGGDFNLTWPLGAPLARVAGRRGLPAHHKRRGVVFPALEIYTFPKPPYAPPLPRCFEEVLVRLLRPLLCRGVRGGPRRASERQLVDLRAGSRVFQVQERFPYLAVPRRLPEPCDGEGFLLVVTHGDEGSGKLGRKKPSSGATPREDDEAATVSGRLAGASEEKGGKGETAR